MVITEAHQLCPEDVFVDLTPVLSTRLFLKCEGFNFAGSVKLKAAVAMVEAAERSGRLHPGTTLVESSSGNLGVALATVAAARGYRFVCVTDTRCNPATVKLIEALGAEVRVVELTHPVSGLLGARLEYVRTLCATRPDHLWLNQYENPDNPGAHARSTAPAIAAAFPGLDVLFVGAGTTGTLMGCARYFRAVRPTVRVVAVDAVGSVSFGGDSGRRLIPGLGMSTPPPALDRAVVDDVVHVDEVDTLRACHRLAGRGFLFGGSTGTVVAGASAWLERHATPDLEAVALAPDLGDRYLDTVYDPDWVADHFGDEALETVLAARAAGSRGAGGLPVASGRVGSRSA